MAKAGDILWQGDTDTMVFRQTSDDTKGAYLEVEATYSPMTDRRPPLHYHPNQDELFQVQEGTLKFLVDGEEKTISAGEELLIPKGQKHTAWNPGPEKVQFIWRTTPALGTEHMFELLWGLVEEGKMGRHGKPKPPLLQSMVMMYSYRDEWRLASPPHPVALPLSAILSVPAHILGYRARHDLDSS